MEALLARAQEAGYKTLILWTAGPLEAAIRQYERFGFGSRTTSGSAWTIAGYAKGGVLHDRFSVSGTAGASRRTDAVPYWGFFAGLRHDAAAGPWALRTHISSTAWPTRPHAFRATLSAWGGRLTCGFAFSATACVSERSSPATLPSDGPAL